MRKHLANTHIPRFTSRSSCHVNRNSISLAADRYLNMTDILIIISLMAISQFHICTHSILTTPEYGSYLILPHTVCFASYWKLPIICMYVRYPPSPPTQRHIFTTWVVIPFQYTTTFTRSIVIISAMLFVLCSLIDILICTMHAAVMCERRRLSPYCLPIIRVPMCVEHKVRITSMACTILQDDSHQTSVCVWLSVLCSVIRTTNIEYGVVIAII